MLSRGFTAEAEQIAVRWQRDVLTSEVWRRVGIPGFQSGESMAFPVRNEAGTTGGFAKPGRRDPTVPRAANEKIAADLAYELQLPVPPAILWKRPNAPANEETHACVSALPFTPAHKWRDVKMGPAGLAARIATGMKAVASAMMAFDCWLSNSDRLNDGNVVAQEDVGGPIPVVRSAYIDYAYIATQTWAGANPSERWRSIAPPAHCYPPEVQLDLALVAASLDRIQALAQSVIEEVVNRIPDEFLTQEKKAVTIAGLEYRQKNLRAEFRKVHPALPTSPT